MRDVLWGLIFSAWILQRTSSRTLRIKVCLLLTYFLIYISVYIARRRFWKVEPILSVVKTYDFLRVLRERSNTRCWKGMKETRGDPRDCRLCLALSKWVKLTNYFLKLEDWELYRLAEPRGRLIFHSAQLFNLDRVYLKVTCFRKRRIASCPCLQELLTPRRLIALYITPQNHWEVHCETSNIPR